jgi:hypothetical protein
MAAVTVTKSSIDRPLAASDLTRSLPTILGTVVIPTVLLGIWELAGRVDALDVRFVPTPSAIFAAWLRLMATGELPAAGIKTLIRVGEGYAIGAGLGVVLGLAYGLWAPLRRGGDPRCPTDISHPRDVCVDRHLRRPGGDQRAGPATTGAVALELPELGEGARDSR